ncbi:hypothetical protein [uncultured Porticoccus sp.]|uniref:hypothetical protein n=1 Tax=uncultured Porticoccus sp. TaxID=1256050 RepID=UPI0030DB2C2C
MNWFYQEVFRASTYSNRPNTDTVKSNFIPLILDLYICHKSYKKLKIAVSRSSNTYSTSRYQSSGVGYRPLDKMIDALESLRYIKVWRGYYDHNVRFGRVTRIRPKSRLIELIESFGIKPKDIKHSSFNETILLKDSDKHAIDYQDTEETRLWRCELAEINKFLSQCYLSLYISNEEYSRLATKMQDRSVDKVRELDLSRIRLRRIYNNSSFDFGGRLYHGWWQEIPSDFRPFIRINHTETVEVDYKAIQLRMIYAIRELNTPRDPYLIEGIPDEKRGVLKKIINIIINADSEHKARTRIELDYPEENTDLLIRATIEKHSQISDLFYSGEGSRLQRADSDLAVRIILRMMREFHTPVLPVHDSFIVRNRFRDELIQVMEEEFRSVYNRTGDTEIESDIRQDRWDQGEGRIYYGETNSDEVMDELNTYSTYYTLESEWGP